MGRKSAIRAFYAPPYEEHKPKAKPADIYAGFDQINGKHPWQKAVPNGYVLYRARKRHGGKIVYFNFQLAKEMGLIPDYHEHKITPELEKKLLDTFALQIINEYDIARHRKFPKKDIKPNYYMATRYLQLQHPDKCGRTSGDGRSIWNGFFTHDGTTWDLSSCGTGVTALSPGSVEAGRPIPTGGFNFSYGCGMAGLDEGLGTALQSEIFHRRGIATERTLVSIEFQRGTAVNVRAGKNLVRPSHLFGYLKQGDHASLKMAVDYFIQRQMKNKEWPDSSEIKNNYKTLLETISLRYARFAAQLEDEYIFCWMDWDGDNMLATGGIIDYGSIRQFGLFHNCYRYDDVQRWSTTITEQKNKARYLVQTFVQLVDFLTTKNKKVIGKFKNSKYLKLFDQEFERQKYKNLLKKIGFSKEQRTELLEQHLPLVKQFHQVFSYFERAKSLRGYETVADGINWNAIFCMRDLLRELPKYYFKNPEPINPQLFLEIMKSDYATPKCLRLNAERKKQIELFQVIYLKFIRFFAKGDSFKRVLLPVIMRSSAINQYTPVTGDGIIYVVESLMRARTKISRDEMARVLNYFIDHQALPYSIVPELPKSIRGHNKEKRILKHILKIVTNFRYTI